MAAILKEDILRRKNKETSSRDKVDKIMNTIVEPLVHANLTKSGEKEGRPAVETAKSAEKENIARRNFFSNEILIDGENATELDELRNSLTGELKPSSEIESILVDRIIAATWRLRRCVKLESQIIEFGASCIQEYEQGFFRVRKRTTKELSQLKALKITEDEGRLDELSRYETLLERQIYRALHELDKLRRHGKASEKSGKRVLRKVK